MVIDSRIKDLESDASARSMSFDQFVLGATLAGLAYLAQIQTYEKLGWNASTLSLAPLILLALSAWLGFKRIESTIHLLRCNARYLELCSMHGGRDESTALRMLERIDNKTGFYYRCRNRVVLLAVISYVGIKVAVAYPIF
ncbi:hypothetical protein D884_03173 [Pseudomonas sp. URMO17WK12:I10]|uniref:hypothetical protein n=1 Tax=unclassified Pseudomonas TaxID=196821 RepID=UPI00067F59B1|nr:MULTISPECIES: hypothetical protein [unclassified Pseudomonas]RDL17076.1 hypothetical protein F633_03489 [Pseudomonas sp. LAMO17WK12:I3]RED05062.1 hypothetical protein D884_03173 [Pseudomonas sp. URMO17WK12:I10]SOD08429.1 hypothetical protein SAMN05660967_01657 [Pseudomonas sp. URMO17WK12:I9]